MTNAIRKVLSQVKWDLNKRKELKKRYELTESDEKLKKIKKAIVLQTPTHGNVGDQAIAYAQKEFLKVNLSDYHYIEIAADDFLPKYGYLNAILNEKDIIFIHGGGNLGTIYPKEEKIRRLIIEQFKNTPIISFPQSASFSDTTFGKRELEKSRKVYGEHSNLTIIGRESRTMEILKKEFPNISLLYTPDIVLYLNERDEKIKRNGVTTAFRKDGEVSIDSSFKEELLSKLEDSQYKLNISDTHRGYQYHIDETNRETILEETWNEFKSSELVLTDRLHGMIFCAITGTPCIVFKNSNHKIEYSYKNWLSNCNFIHLAEDNKMSFDELKNIMERLIKSKPNTINLKEQYAPLVKLLEEVKTNE